MAAHALYTITSRIISRIETPAFQVAYEKAKITWGVEDKLKQFKETIQTIQSALVDVERKQEASSFIKHWVKRVKNILYDTEDLLNDIATEELVIKNMAGNRLVNMAKRFFSNSNPIMYSYFVSVQIDSLRSRLVHAYADLSQFQSVHFLPEELMPLDGGRTVESIPFVDPDYVIGRDKDKRVVMDFLFDDTCTVIALVAMGGMGKTTIIKLVYNDEVVKKNFENRWWVPLSRSTADIQVKVKILQSITEERCTSLNDSDVTSRICQLVAGKKFILILDDVQDDIENGWVQILSILQSAAAVGSKVIVTTRYSAVVAATRAKPIHYVDPLSKEDSWNLFERLAYTEEKRDDPLWNAIGKEILQKCSGIPLAIETMAYLLLTKSTIEEWRLIRNKEISRIELRANPIMATLKISYDKLSVDLKQCFAYCSLFPKNHEIDKRGLIHLWIAQGYVPTEYGTTVEEMGDIYFQALLQRSFLQLEVCYDIPAEFWTCKMHPLMHDLACFVAGDETTCVSGHSGFGNNFRHASIVGKLDAFWEIPAPLISACQLRSLLFMAKGSLSPLCLNQLLTKLKLLRSLDIHGLGIFELPSCIGELKHLRFLDLSGNDFEYLPDSITKLINLLSLDVSLCDNLKDWPNEFRKLINLRHLNLKWCTSLQNMPLGLGELTSLCSLPLFKVGRGNIMGAQNSDIGALSKLMLKGVINMNFRKVLDCWSEDECWDMPVTMKKLQIEYYPGRRLPIWGGDRWSMPPNIVSLELFCCKRVKHLPPLRLLPGLIELKLFSMDELEYVEDEEEEVIEAAAAAATSASLVFFPTLKKLSLHYLPRLKGWSKKVQGNAPVQLLAEPSFPLLSDLRIEGCPEFEPIQHRCPSLRI